ncbi:Acyl-CoA synthetase X1 R [Carabus blaptoides fortunei]
MDVNDIAFLRSQGNVFGLPENPELVPDRGIGEIYFEKMKEHAEKIAQIDAVTGKEESYAEMLSRTIRVAQGLQIRGITEDDVVALCSFNTMENQIPILASLFLNIKSINIDPRTPLHEVIPLLEQVTPKIIFCASDAVKTMEEAVANLQLHCEIVTFENTQTHTPYSEFLVRRSPEDEFRPVPVQSVYDVALMHFSSGTTNVPKAVCCRHYALYYGLKWFMLKMQQIDVIINFISPYCASSSMLVFWSIMTGTPRVICEKFDPETTCKYMEVYKANTTILATVIVNMMTKHPEICNYDLSAMRNIMVGGSVVTADTCRKFIRLFPHASMNICYGMTETFSAIFLYNTITEDKLINNTVSVGTPLPGVTYKIVDTDTDEALGPNQIGELRIKSKGIFAAYYNQPESYASVFDSEGFYKTGDMLYYDENYEFYVVDRIKDMFKYNSCQIKPKSIENVLLTHPDVAECVVVGIPTENIGEIPTGVVVLKNGKRTRPEELLEYVNARVDVRFRLDGGVRIVDSLPYTISGKIQSRLIRETIMREQLGSNNNAH